MKIYSHPFSTEEPLSGGALALYLLSDKPVPSPLPGENTLRMAELLLKDPSFKGKKGKIVRIPLEGEGISSLYLVGLGERKGYSEENVRSRTAELLRRCRSDGTERITLLLPEKPDGEMSSAVAEGAELGRYSFDRYKTVREEDRLPETKEVILAGGDDAGLEKGKLLGCAQNWARDLANEPGNVHNPLTLADLALEWGEDFGFSVEVWDEKRIASEGMGGLYAVGMGSATPPRLVHMIWKPEGTALRKIALVGKGITFDSGGLNLKPGDFIRTMKGDKSGACNIFAILRGVSKMKIPCEVHGIVALAENMPGGRAFRPDDILRMHNGRTVEVDNTDAEGRLVLADALSYASNLAPDGIIDMATLTGACVVALGTNMGGLFASSDELAEGILSAAARRGERFWRMPLDDERITETLKSPVADLVNAAGRYGGAIFAAQFLREFVKEGIPWAHLDIAGVDFFKDEYSVCCKGASGYAVRTCLEYLLSCR